LSNWAVVLQFSHFTPQFRSASGSPSASPTTSSRRHWLTSDLIISRSAVPNRCFIPSSNISLTDLKSVLPVSCPRGSNNNNNGSNGPCPLVPPSSKHLSSGLLIEFRPHCRVAWLIHLLHSPATSPAELFLRLVFVRQSVYLSLRLFTRSGSTVIVGALIDAENPETWQVRAANSPTRTPVSCASSTVATQTIGSSTSSSSTADTANMLPLRQLRTALLSERLVGGVKTQRAFSDVNPPWSQLDFIAQAADLVHLASASVVASPEKTTPRLPAKKRKFDWGDRSNGDASPVAPPPIVPQLPSLQPQPQSASLIVDKPAQLGLESTRSSSVSSFAESCATTAASLFHCSVIQRGALKLETPVKQRKLSYPDLSFTSDNAGGLASLRPPPSIPAFSARVDVPPRRSSLVVDVHNSNDSSSTSTPTSASSSSSLNIAVAVSNSTGRMRSPPIPPQSSSRWKGKFPSPPTPGLSISIPPLQRYPTHHSEAGRRYSVFGTPAGLTPARRHSSVLSVTSPIISSSTAASFNASTPLHHQRQQQQHQQPPPFQEVKPFSRPPINAKSMQPEEDTGSYGPTAVGAGTRPLSAPEEPVLPTRSSPLKVERSSPHSAASPLLPPLSEIPLFEFGLGTTAYYLGLGFEVVASKRLSFNSATVTNLVGSTHPHQTTSKYRATLEDVLYKLKVEYGQGSLMVYKRLCMLTSSWLLEQPERESSFLNTVAIKGEHAMPRHANTNIPTCRDSFYWLCSMRACMGVDCFSYFSGYHQPDVQALHKAFMHLTRSDRDCHAVARIFAQLPVHLTDMNSLAFGGGKRVSSDKGIQIVASFSQTTASSERQRRMSHVPVLGAILSSSASAANPETAYSQTPNYGLGDRKRSFDSLFPITKTRSYGGAVLLTGNVCCPPTEKSFDGGFPLLLVSAPTSASAAEFAAATAVASGAPASSLIPVPVQIVPGSAAGSTTSASSAAGGDTGVALVSKTTNEADQRLVFPLVLAPAPDGQMSGCALGFPLLVPSHPRHCPSPSS
uniref:Non-specific serine/threonine protein kinase n=1 Tax=Taenia asiatica TaxID=60517 RepID=A0A158R6K4_TAEAS